MLVLMVTVTVMMVVAWAVPVVVTLKAGAWVRTTASDGDDDVKQGVGDGGGGLFQHRRSLATSVSDSNVGVSKAATAASHYQNGMPRFATSSSRAWLITTLPSGTSASPSQPVGICPAGKSPSWDWRLVDQWCSCPS